MKKYLKMLPFLMLAALFGLMAMSGGQRMRNMLVWTSPAMQKQITNAVSQLDIAGDAFAVEGFPVAGPLHPPLGVANECSGTGTLVAGAYSLQVPCLANYTNVGCAMQGLATPGSFLGIACGATAVATITVPSGATASATVTAIGIQILAGTGTANATPVVSWWGVK